MQTANSLQSISKFSHSNRKWAKDPNQGRIQMLKTARNYSSSTNESPRQNVGSLHELAVCTADEAKKSFREVLSESLLTNYANEDIIAPFSTSEIKIGQFLGSGEFSNVYEIKSFRLDASVDASASYDELELRRFMKSLEKYRGTKKARYAMKHLRPELVRKTSSEYYAQSARDLVEEAELLQVLSHPNIIKLRGISHQDSAGFAHGPKGYFLVIDRLDEILVDRITKWKQGPCTRKNSLDLLRGSIGKSTKVKGKECNVALLPQQLEVALQLSAALVYLHERRCIYRDLKPENAGFDVRGDLKLFDFGLAKIMPANGIPYEDSYNMSLAGTPRYMAQEVLGGKSGYNLKADVYSFGVVLWEILSLEKPFWFIRNRHALVSHIVRDGGRPEINPEWPQSIKELLTMSFDAQHQNRPTMIQVLEVIRSTLSEMKKGDTSKLRDSYILRRRSIASINDPLLEVEPIKKSKMKIFRKLRTV